MMHHWLSLTIASVIFALSPLCFGTSATGFFYNKTNATLTLQYYSAEFGTFTSDPPETVGSYGSAQWSLSGTGWDGYGWIEYDVYYIR